MTQQRIPGWFRLFAAVLTAGLAGSLRAEDYAITTFAGTHNTAGSADGKPGAFSNPYGVAMDAAKNLYVADTVTNIIRKITPAGQVSTLAGAPGQMGTTDGTGSAARFNFPVGVAVDAAGNVYVSDSKSFTIRKITTAGVVSTYAGAAYQLGSTDGAAASARFFLPYGLAIDAAGTLYVADGGNHTIRKIAADGTVSTLAGSAMQSGSADGVGAAARFNNPFGVVVDGSGNVYVADSGNHVIRRITSAGVVTTLAGATGIAAATDGTGTAARFNQPRGVAVGAGGVIFVADFGNALLRQVTSTGVVSTLAGAPGIVGDANSVGGAARFYDPTGIVADGTTVYVADTANNLIRRGVPASQAGLPTITIQPLDQEVATGQAVSFRVAAAGGTLTYQWYKNGVSIAGANAATYGISSAQATDVAAYTVRITGAGGSIDSAQGNLTVTPPGSGSIVITARPLSLHVETGQSASFSVAATGSGLTYQWQKNGVNIAGATSTMYTIASAQSGDVATYTVRIMSGAVTEQVSAKLNVGAATVGTAITSHPTSQSVNAGQAASFSVSAVGTGLTFQWYKNGTAISGATASVYTIGSAQAGDAGTYMVRVSGTSGTADSSTASLTVTSAQSGPSARLSNLSVRTSMDAGQVLFVGTVVSGGAREVLVRAAGPALAAFGLTTAMADPRLDLYSGQTLITGNDDWSATLAGTFASVGAFAFPSGSKDAALVRAIEGAHTLQARGTGPGVVLVEAYDLGTGNSPRMINVSARNIVGTGDNILIAGFTIVGTGSKNLLIRAVGPKLAAFGVPGTLADPKLEVYSGQTKLTENDDWASSLSATFASVGAFALDAGSKDAALLTALTPGSYTVQVRGADGGTGEALVEIYEVP